MRKVKFVSNIHFSKILLFHIISIIIMTIIIEMITITKYYIFIISIFTYKKMKTLLLIK